MTTSSSTSNTDRPQHQTTSNNVDVGNLSKSTGDGEAVVVQSENKGFDEIYSEATITQDERKDQQNQQAQTEPGKGLPFSQEEAASLALMGLDAGLGIVAGVTGFQPQISNEFRMLFAAMTTPLMLKYGDSIKKLLEAPSQADLDGYMPEALAVGAVAVVGIPTYMQIKEVKKLRAYEEKLKRQRNQQGTAPQSEATQEQVVADGD